ncbi:hypothetical protein [Pseudoflavitalea rhizosphaerae]|uniref:hypothetical protein n=1 Tax=Pseudoflavitalea rhizosphaerae TaxID=1884793 RepID=UPI000F8D13C7|nr:hypothetical protein [Pseudoflavitalea rhizosphaerae]
MKASIFLSVVMMMVVGVSVSQAQPIREKNQKERIYNGVKTGQLTKAEAYRLHKDQKDIRHDRMRYKRNDGRISPRERKHLIHERKMAGRKIYHHKHNGRVRCK